MAGFMLYSSRVGKVRGRERLLDLVPWTGGEVVLDVGCGRGLMAVGAAKRLTTGRAVGIDLWRAEDQSGNRPDAAAENARREGVADRVEVQTGDMRRLDHPDAAFDVVVSHWAVHNLPAEADRLAAVREMVRVLKPGGTIVLADIAHHAEYVRHLTACGLTDAREVGGGWRAALAAVVSFGNFRPAAVVATKGGAERGSEGLAEPTRAARHVGDGDATLRREGR
jgi:ubiquinone/menaquinone biosynthesis C-methylase UbiE